MKVGEYMPSPGQSLLSKFNEKETSSVPGEYYTAVETDTHTTDKIYMLIRVTKPKSLSGCNIVTSNDS